MNMSGRKLTRKTLATSLLRNEMPLSRLLRSYTRNFRRMKRRAWSNGQLPMALLIWSTCKHKTHSGGHSHRKRSRRWRSFIRRLPSWTLPLHSLSRSSAIWKPCFTIIHRILLCLSKPEPLLMKPSACNPTWQRLASPWPTSIFGLTAITGKRLPN